MPVLQILLGAGFTVALMAALGVLALRALKIPLDRRETLLLGLVTGAACLSVAVFALCAAGQARMPVFLAGGLPILFYAAFLWRRNPPPPTVAAPAPLAWRAFFHASWALFTGVYFVNALAPEVSPDGSGYHLGNVLRMALHHGFAWDYHSLYSYFPQGMEMLFLVAFPLGGHSAAALVHTAFLAALPLLMASFGERLGFPRSGMAAGLLVLASPVVGIDGSSAYNDVALATLGFAVLYVTQLKVDKNKLNQFILIGLLSGFCFGLKYTGWLALPLGAIQAFRRPMPWKTMARLAGGALAGAALTALPWLVRNWIWLGNPVAPFANRWFPNPYYYPGPEHEYLAGLRDYSGYQHWWQIPADMALRGEFITGILGPVFLLAPLALLALRRPLGRWLLMSAAVWALPVWFNSGTRFLIPALPFLALAMGLALENSWGVLPAAAAFQLWACWPSVGAAYAAPWSWRIHDIPWAVALRREPASAFLAARLPDTVFRPAMERHVPAGGKIFSYAGRPEAYLPRTIVAAYESAFGLLLQEILAQAFSPEAQESCQWTLSVPRASGMRIVARAGADSPWRVGRIQVSSGGTESGHAGWRYTASPNPWQAELAFAGSPVLRWQAWEPLRSGFFVQADFPQPIPISEICFETGAAPDAHPVLEVETTPGTWQPVPDSSLRITPIPLRDLRAEALRELQARGVSFLLINDSDPPAQDLKQHTNLVTLLQEAHGTRFYRID